MKNFKEYFEKKLNEETKFKVGDKVTYSVNGNTIDFKNKLVIDEIYPSGVYLLNNGHKFDKNGIMIGLINQDKTPIKLMKV